MSQGVVDIPKADGNGAAETKPRTAYISAPKSFDTRVLRDLLESKDVKTFSPDQLDLPGQNLSQILKQGMERADLVVGIIDATPESSFVFYELGLAQALNKATVVLLVGDVPASTWLASGIPYFRFDPAKPTGLEFGISQILKVPHHATRTMPFVSRRTHPIGAAADELLARLQAGGDGIREAELEAVIEQAIRESGVATVSQGGVQNGCIDLAVWSDDLSPWVGNPFPIAIGLRLLRKAEVTAASNQLTLSMAAGTMFWGLLIHHLSAVDLDAMLGVPSILCISAQRFLEELRDRSFGDLIRGLRNQRVHGVA
jgi:hypothetical protein